jgi:hypothetical protein
VLDPSRANSTSNKWFYVTLSGHQGFVKAEQVSNQWTGSPYCGNDTTGLEREVIASLAATGIVRFGVAYPAAPSDRQTMAAAPFHKPDDTSSNGWGPHYGWAGDCISYAAVSWHSAGVNIYFANAIDVLSSTTTSRGARSTQRALPRRAARLSSGTLRAAASITGT